MCLVRDLTGCEFGTDSCKAGVLVGLAAVSELEKTKHESCNFYGRQLIRSLHKDLGHVGVHWATKFLLAGWSTCMLENRPREQRS